MLPYGRQSISEADIAAVTAVLRGDWLTTGPAVTAFEEAVSQLAGGHRAVSCTSGTAALHIAYAALGVGPGDEVVTTPMTFVATASSAALLGAKVVFADVDADTALLDPAAAAAVTTERTKVIAAVDYAGQAADYSALQAVADAVGARTVADAAHSVGGRADGRPVGDLADVTTMSFFPTKNLTTGEGGAVVCKDPAVAQWAHEFHFIGLVRDPERFEIADEGPWHQEVHEYGVNYRLTDLGAALGLSQLARLEGFKQRRAEITARYNAAFAGADGLRTPVQRAGVDPMWHLYPVRVLDGRRREVFEAMRAAGIGVQVNYIPVYWHPVFARQGYRRGLCPNAEAFYAEELSLPLYPDLTDNDVDRVIDTLLRLVG
ncbi:aminotransferase class I/II-fold pyridoxal phosphate-dependent enzyme [Kribbella sandramycini]|uniref:Aminotransferase class I/II-fold pyridoxal phosphate-dependent enzyme n=1 Tax=Kribbella sandramycini TaxID=60450 RepID=A0A7Y4L620_9ACTN|nr:aminotransferase class I/II-fold pyridoxal phosphate-dependent enzyme [Kribbella sandramycini]MBB6566037.1 dTDP-4-amino-4,6-dideoxygalactose transaminase [Kribbella sandramycini]NOL45038.1 aminotransferase class I/II-fold pyridoxal phosphate-dependent enzyme [Kribbella sandramycini]